MLKEVDVILYGNSLAVMVAAEKLSHIPNYKITVLNPSTHWGGHFSTLTVNGRLFDLGMILFEFTSFNYKNKELISSYNPLRRNDSGRFLDYVDEYISSMVESGNVETPQMYYDGLFYDDFLIANNINSLLTMNLSSGAQVELECIVGDAKNNSLHASKKTTSNVFLSASFHEVSLINHGQQIHNKLIEPYCKKLLNVGSAEVVALYHRVPWLPLYYPETLLSHLKGDPVKLDPTQFRYPLGLPASALTTKILQKLKSSPTVSLVEDASLSDIVQVNQNTFEFAIENEVSYQSTNVVWGSENSRLLNLLDSNRIEENYQKTTVILIFLTIPEDVLLKIFTVLNVVDELFAVYRISNQTILANKTGLMDLAIEINLNYYYRIYGVSDDSGLLSNVFDELENLGVTSSLPSNLKDSVKIIKSQLMIPNLYNMDLFTREYKDVQNHCPSFHLAGPSSGFFSSSMNDQIIQGLKISSEIKDKNDNYNK